MDFIHGNHENPYANQWHMTDQAKDLQLLLADDFIDLDYLDETNVV